MPNDTERLNFIQAWLREGRYTGKCILRESVTGRGFRLHETSKHGATPDVREAIDNAMREKGVIS